MCRIFSCTLSGLRQFYRWFPFLFSDGPFPLPGSLSLSHSLCHPSFGDEHLRGSVQRYLHASLAPSTRCTYQAGVKHFLTFTLMHGLIGPSNPLLPASEITLMYFASHLANTVSYETVKLYLVAVQDLHRELNFPLQLTEMHRLQKVLTGIKRLTPTKRRDRFPITLTVLHSIHSYLKPKFFHNLNHVMLWAVFTLAFFGFLRSSEFTCNGSFDPSVHLTCNDITLLPNSHSPSHMLVHIKQSKTDPFRQGHTLAIAKSSSPICSVMAMTSSSADIQPTFVCLRPTQTMATRNNLTTELRTVQQQCGLPANNFYSHSFRIGAATTAAKVGLPPWLIKVLGHWSSDCYECYIRTPKCTILEVPRLLANTSP